MAHRLRARDGDVALSERRVSWALVAVPAVYSQERLGSRRQVFCLRLSVLCLRTPISCGAVEP